MCDENEKINLKDLHSNEQIFFNNKMYFAVSCKGQTIAKIHLQTKACL